MLLLRDDAGPQLADVRVGGLGDGQHGAGALGSWGPVLVGGGARALAGAVGVPLQGELQQATSLLDQQVNLPDGVEEEEEERGFCEWSF